VTITPPEGDEVLKPGVLHAVTMPRAYIVSKETGNLAIMPDIWEFTIVSEPSIIIVITIGIAFCGGVIAVFFFLGKYARRKWLQRNEPPEVEGEEGEEGGEHEPLTGLEAEWREESRELPGMAGDEELRVVSLTSARQEGPEASIGPFLYTDRPADHADTAAGAIPHAPDTFQMIVPRATSGNPYLVG